MASYAAVILATFFRRFLDACHSSYRVCIPAHNSGLVPNASDRRKAMSAEIRAPVQYAREGDPRHAQMLGRVSYSHVPQIISNNLSRMGWIEHPHIFGHSIDLQAQ
jgi:hypothetical protein